MIFSPVALPLVLSGDKTQTRRIPPPGLEISNVLGVPAAWLNGRMYRWVGRQYAIQPARCAPAVGHFKLLDLRLELVQHISNDDAHAELGDPGVWCAHFASVDFSTYLMPFVEEFNVAIFKWLWNTIHKKPGRRWADNPRVLVYEFEVL